MTQVYASRYEHENRWVALPYFLFVEMLHMHMHVAIPIRWQNQSRFSILEHHTPKLWMLLLLCIELMLLFLSFCFAVGNDSIILKHLLHFYIPFKRSLENVVLQLLIVVYLFPIQFKQWLKREIYRNILYGKLYLSNNNIN